MNEEINKPNSPISTLIGMEDKITTIRRDGNTTRIVDNAIQMLFTNGSIFIEDHFKGHDSQKILMNKIINRIRLEHPHIKLKVSFQKITIDKQKPAKHNGAPHMFADLNRVDL